MAHPGGSEFSDSLVEESLAHVVAQGGKPKGKAFYTDLYVGMGTHLRFAMPSHVIAHYLRETGSPVYM